MGVRNALPKANNQDALVYALYLIGGSDRQVDVEEIYLKCFEIAPARLGWRTRPDLPDYKKTSKALQSVESKELPGLLAKPHPLARRLTHEGTVWVEANRDTLERIYGGSVAVSGASQGAHENLRRTVRASQAFADYEAGATPVLVDLADALQCSPGSPYETWTMRLAEVRRAGQVLDDAALLEFADTAEHVLVDREVM